MTAWLLRVLRIPERPSPPPASETSVEVFRASPKFLHYSMLKWAVGQFFALAGLLFSFLLLGGFEAFEDLVPWRIVDRLLGGRAREIRGSMTWIQNFETLGWAAFFVQFAISGFLVKLRWDTRWHMVTDTAIRIREGLFNLREQTLTIARIQNMRVRQGPIERLLGIANLEVQTAGGGQVAASDGGTEEPKTHVGRFLGIENVEALRDRLRVSLARSAETGLGESVRESPATDETENLDGAVREVLAAARSLRRAAEDAWG